MVEEEMLELGLFAGGGGSGHASRAARRRKPVIWIHIHKAAGSLICGLATANNEYTIAPSTNCNWINHDNCCDAGHVSCQERMDEFETQGASWSAIERVIEEEDICPEFFNYGMQEIELSFAPINHHRLWRRSSASSLGTAAWVAKMAGGASPAVSWRARRPGTGSPSGGGLTTSSCAPWQGKQREVLIFLDEIANETSVLRHAFGWTELPETTPRGHATPEESRRVHLPEDQLVLARQSNHWDYALYNRFKEMPLTSRVQPLE